MRLIDADGLKIAIRQELDIAEQMAGDEADIFISKMIEEAFFDIIDNTITIEPERKTGKWIIKDNPGTGWYRVTCSECGEDVTSTIPMIGFFPNAKPLWDYCPYCGTKMEAEDNGKQ